MNARYGAVTSGRADARENGVRKRYRRTRYVAALAAVAAALLAGAGIAAWAAHSTSNGNAPTRSASATNPLFIVQPRAVTQAARIGTLQLVLAANPALPGPNHVVVTLVNHDRAMTGARVRVAATMPGMVMRPLGFPARERQGGHYTGAASLSMFGRWQLTVVVERRHAVPVMHVLALNLDFPSRLLKALGAHGGTR